MDCCWKILKFLFVLVNLLITLMGIGALALFVLSFFDPTATLVTKGAQSYTIWTYILLAIGGFMIIVGFLGCCGALCENPGLLGTYFTFLLILLAAEIAGGVWAYMNRDELTKILQDSVRDTIRQDYGKNKLTTEIFDQIQQSLKCCGAETFASWSNSAYNRAGDSNKSVLEIGISALSPSYMIPKSCCVNPDSDICESSRKLGSLNIISSATGVIHTEGCLKKMETVLKQYSEYFVGIGIAIGVVELLGMIFSMLLCCAIVRTEDHRVFRSYKTRRTTEF